MLIVESGYLLNCATNTKLANSAVPSENRIDRYVQVAISNWLITNQRSHFFQVYVVN